MFLLTLPLALPVQNFVFSVDEVEMDNVDIAFEAKPYAYEITGITTTQDIVMLLVEIQPSVKQKLFVRNFTKLQS